MECIELKKRYESARSARRTIESTWQLIEKFVVPYRGKFFEDNKTEGSIQWRKRDLFDTTAVDSAQSLAANIHSALTNPTVRWFGMRFRDDAINEMQEAKAWIDESTEIIYYALQESNFNLEANEVYLDLVSFGTAILVEEVEEALDGSLESVDFQAIPVKECFFEQDTKGRLINLYRRLEWTSIQIVDKFGINNVPENVKDNYENSKQVDTKFTVIFAIWKREVGEEGEPNTFEILPPESRPYGYKYFMYQTAERLGDEGGYYEMPAFAPRWRKTSGSMWGHSPSMIALGDILTVNQLVEMVLKANDKAIDPPILTTRRGVFGNVDLNAGGATVVASLESIAPFESAARFDVSALTKQDLQEAIKKAFFVDQLQLKESPAMTATEVNVRFQLMQRLLGPTLGRLQHDFLDPLIERTFKILFRYGMIPDIPDIILQAGGSELEIEYLGPLSKSQRFDDVANIERWLGDVTNMSERWPEALDIVEPIETARELGTAIGVPAKIMRSSGTIKLIQDQRQIAMTEERNLALAQQQAETGKTVAEGLEVIEGGQS